MILNILIVFIFTFHFATSQYREAAQIDSTMTTDRTKCIDHEATISALDSKLSTTIVNVTATLRGEFLSKDLCTALDNLNSLLKMQMTINSFIPYVNISTCGDINYKVTMIDFDQQKIQRVRAKASANITALYARYAQVAIFSSQIIRTSYYTSVTSIMTRTIAIVTELSRYSGITLGQALINCLINSNLLNVFKRTYCTCLKTAAMSGYNSTLEANVNAVEAQLVKIQASIRNLTTTALNSVKSAYTSVTTGGIAGTLASTLLNLQGTLTTLQTASDYPPIVWTNVANCNDLMIRVKYIQFKQNQYVNIFIDNNRNISWLTYYQINVNISALQPAALYLKGAQLQALRDCINVTQRLRARMTSYNDQIVYSITRMARIAGDIQGLGDTYCTCEIAGFTTTTTTLSTSTTTTETTTSTTTEEPTTTTEEITTIDFGPTLSPCGTFIPYDPSADMMAPTIDGFSAGLAPDGSELYVGKGTNLNCGQMPCPAKIVVNPPAPGAYMSCADAENYDPITAEYLQTNPKLTWVETTTTNMATVPGALSFKTVDGLSQFFFGRYRDPSTGEVFLGKVQMTMISSSFNFWDSTYGYEATLIDGFEILTCPP